jgi:FKBP-type peptidyl-prolyl cis-trans isomerase
LVFEKLKRLIIIRLKRKNNGFPILLDNSEIKNKKRSLYSYQNFLPLSKNIFKIDIIMSTKEIKVILSLLTFILFSFTACNEDDNTNEQWRKENQKAYDEIKTAASWKLISTPPGIPSGVYYEDISNENVKKGDEYPIQTASVTINYTGTYYNNTVFDSGVNSVFNVNSIVRGLGVALQNMVTGDKWNICIPYHLGYGTVTTGTIPAYTTLFFEVELIKINQHP